MLETSHIHETESKNVRNEFPAFIKLLDDVHLTNINSSQLFEDNVLDAAHRLLISIESPHIPYSQRVIAVETLAQMVRLHGGELEIFLIEVSKAYFRGLNIEDADVSSPSLIDVLKLVGNINEDLFQVIAEAVKSGFGLQRWAGLRALCCFNDAVSKRLLADIILAKFPPNFGGAEHDLCVIKAAMGEDEFVALLSQANVS